MDYFFEDYHFCISLQPQDSLTHSATMHITLEIHHLARKQHLQTIQFELENTSAAEALIAAQRRMRQWLRYRQPTTPQPSTLADVQSLLRDKTLREEALYQQLMDADSEDARIECFYRMKQAMEQDTLRLVRTMSRLHARERDALFEQEPNLVAEMLHYDVDSVTRT